MRPLVGSLIWIGPNNWALARFAPRPASRGGAYPWSGATLLRSLLPDNRRQDDEDQHPQDQRGRSRAELEALPAHL